MGDGARGQKLPWDAQGCPVPCRVLSGSLEGGYELTEQEWPVGTDRMPRGAHGGGAASFGFKGLTISILPRTPGVAHGIPQG